MDAFVRLLAVGAGGFCGAVARYLIGLGFEPLVERVGFPFGTMVANILGCALIGILSGLVLIRGTFTLEMRLLLITGLLGSLTTFSTFSFESVALLRRGRLDLALFNIGVQLGLGLAAVAAGYWLVVRGSGGS